MKTNKIFDYKFRCIDGVWTLINGDSPIVLADFLESISVPYIPDFTQFLRIIEPERLLEYRAYGGTICITIKNRD